MWYVLVVATPQHLTCACLLHGEGNILHLVPSLYPGDSSDVFPVTLGYNDGYIRSVSLYPGNCSCQHLFISLIRERWYFHHYQLCSGEVGWQLCHLHQSVKFQVWEKILPARGQCISCSSCADPTYLKFHWQRWELCSLLLSDFRMIPFVGGSSQPGHAWHPSRRC